MIQPSNTPGPFVTIVTIFPGSIFSHCREDCLWRLQVWQWMFHDLAGKDFLTPSPHTCAPWNAPLDSPSNSSLGNRQWEQLIPTSQHPQQWHSSSSRPSDTSVAPKPHQLQGCWRGRPFHPEEQKFQFRTTISREEPWSGMCLPCKKEKLLRSDYRFEKLHNYTLRSLMRDQIHHFKVLEGRHYAKTHRKAQPP